LESNKIELVRVAKLLSQRGVCSRREAERRIADGRVMVNREIIIDTSSPVNPEKDEILVDGLPIPSVKNHIYFAYHKPAGVLSSFKKDKEKGYTLSDVLKVDRFLFPAGRLDRDSIGLLILTSDGEWANKVMHPRYDKSKEYLVKFHKQRPTPAYRKMKDASFEEKGKKFKAKEVTVAGSYVRIVLAEGRNRQIHRLAESVGLKVHELIRIRVGEVELGNLKEGKYRKLTESEIESLATE